MLVCLPSICLLSIWHLSLFLPSVYLPSICLSICQHLSVFLSICVPDSLSICPPVLLFSWCMCIEDYCTCDILFFSFEISSLFILDQPLVFSSSLIVQPPLLSLCIFHVLLIGTYHSLCLNCISSKIVNTESCSHHTYIWLPLRCFFLGSVGHLFPFLLSCLAGSVEPISPFLFPFPLTYSGFAFSKYISYAIKSSV